MKTSPALISSTVVKSTLLKPALRLLLILFFLLILNINVYADLMNGLIGWWKMDEGTGAATTADSSGQGNTGTLVNSPAWVTGKFKSALSFNGTNQTMTAASVPTTSSPWSISCWVYYPSFLAANLPITCGFDKQGDDNGIVGFGYSLNIGGIQYSKILTNGLTPAHGNIVMQINTWYLLTETSDGTNLTLYVNGNFDYTVTPSSTLWRTANEVSVARGYFSGSNKYIPATVDDIRVYNRALTSTEINDLYLIGLGRVVYGKNSYIASSKTSY